MKQRSSTAAGPETASLPLSRPSAAIGAQPSPPRATAGEGLTLDGASSASSQLAPPWNLLQRLTAIASEVKVEATGNTGRQAGNQRAISIGDVDEALGPLFVKYGVVSDYQFKEAPTSFKMPTRDGEMTMWLVGIQAHIYNVDDPKDSLDRLLMDIGSNPSAAVSFALKRWLRALFKLVEDDDQPEDHGTGRTTPADKAATQHLSAEELTELDRLNKACIAPVPAGIPWNSLVAGRSFEQIKFILEARREQQAKPPAKTERA